MLLPGGTVKGTVHDSAGAAPLDNVTVTAYTAGGLKVASAGSDHLGNFTIDGLGAGSYFLATSNTQGYDDEVYDDVACGTCDPSRGRAVPVTGGQTTSGIAFALTRGALLSGRVVDTTGNPRGGVPVSIFDAAGTLVARAVSHDDGQYAANARAGTSYAKAGGVDGLATALYDGQPCPDGGCDPVSGTPIVGAAGETVRGIDFSLAVCSPLSLSPVALSSGNVGASYTATLSVAGGTGSLQVCRIGRDAAAGYDARPRRNTFRYADSRRPLHLHRQRHRLGRMRCRAHLYPRRRGVRAPLSSTGRVSST